MKGKAYEIYGSVPVVDGEGDFTSEVVEVADEAGHDFGEAGVGVGSGGCNYFVGEGEVIAVLFAAGEGVFGAADGATDVDGGVGGGHAPGLCLAHFDGERMDIEEEKRKQGGPLCWWSR